jgi:hypothetical protein
MGTPGEQWVGGKPPAHVIEYVEWLVTPEALRVPSTKNGWAEEHGFNRKTLNEWERDDRVRWAIRDRADQLNMSPERIQGVMNAMWRKAEQGDVQAAKLYMDHVDKLMPREPSKAQGFEDMTDEQLAELAKEVLDGNPLRV